MRRAVCAGFLASVIVLAAGAPPGAGVGGQMGSSAVAAAPATLRVTSTDISAALVRGRSNVRGPVAAALPDGRLLLGGGRDGNMLMIWNPGTGAVFTIGAIIRASQRRPDARYAPTDIEVMHIQDGRARLFVSFPELVRSRSCVRVAVNRIDITLTSRPQITGSAKVLRTKPCVRPNAIQHASGRLARISRTTAYVTVGDLGHPRINSRSKRGQLGSVLRIAQGKKARRVSQGHRNGQGLLIDSGGNLWETEHGPRGGDELNLIGRGRDYGWPFVTLGRPYGTGDYVKPRRSGTHRGYTAPRAAWVPSVATSEIVQVPRTWPGWIGPAGADLLMGTLKDLSLWRIRVTGAEQVMERQRIPVGHRIRDLEILANGSLAATTDDGRLLLIAP